MVNEKLMVAPLFCMKMTQLIDVGLTTQVPLSPLVSHSCCQTFDTDFGRYSFVCATIIDIIDFG